MKQALIFLGTALLAALFSLAPAQDKEADGGRKIFIEKKCNACHSVEVVGLKKKPNQKPPDLSSIGSELNSSFIAAYLRQKETLHDKKHLAAFKGNDEDLQTLAQWLDSLKETKRDSLKQQE